ncbi:MULTISPECIES: cytochrome C [unclassified Pseudomonas]|uniref:cytochrome C n=1 Tax=unclassified Pseudomonas TaxID=196821 RepID=UPI00191148E7|nr:MULTISPECIES: cytochrome C [unclassified Pseudomonas]MBK5550005.1 cytochrome C [Pseudomonas sp. TH03]MEB0227639.1 cytochrome C [Pseudomonas sp. 5S1]MEB0296649.1 cytochrome C [Pseudomonas sp. 10S4]WPX17794.1 cytochrome C [Pseudomonas sp. 10S4]
MYVKDNEECGAKAVAGSFHFWPFGRTGILLGLLFLVFCQSAQALPSFARQTGQSCVACHAGGQFPELTPYGRLFKLTGYTNGVQTNPLAAMIVGDYTGTRNNSDGAGGSISPKDKQMLIDYSSVFLGGKITDVIGGFAQFTYSSYDHQDASGNWVSHLGSDNFDLRYADRKVDTSRDVIWGVTLNNNPTVQDVWNSTPAWGYPYVSSTLGAFGGAPASTLIEGGLAQQVAGIGAYVYLNKSLYLELTSYQTAKDTWSFLSLGNKKGDTYHPLTYMDGSSPYARLAYTYEWGAQNVMVGAFAMNAKILPMDDSNNPVYGQGSTEYRDTGFDAQYQYLLDPHAFTAQIRYVKEEIRDHTQTLYDGPASLRSFKVKGSYVYLAKYGASLAYSNVNGSSDATAYADSANFSPDTQMWTPEVFWLPMQNLRVGLQYNYFTRYLGASNNYDGNGRNASDNDTTYLYMWYAF